MWCTHHVKQELHFALCCKNLKVRYAHPVNIVSDVTGFLKAHAKPLLVILGQTASGKTGFSIDLSEKLLEQGITVEIINADSRQLYKGMDIGTAKITQEEMKNISHHLFSVIDPSFKVTVAWYKEEVEKIIQEIHARGHVPCLVGGSMLYISSVIDGLELLPPANPELRAELEKEYEKDNGVSLHQFLMNEDPETASGIHPNNRPYIIRAAEIIRTTGEKPSKLKESKTSPYDLFIIGIMREKDDLHAKIEQRSRQLLQSGWIEEVKALKAQGFDATTPGMNSVGYQEILNALDSEMNDTALAEVITSKTKKYAKRQMTWWGKDPRIHWVVLNN